MAPTSIESTRPRTGSRSSSDSGTWRLQCRHQSQLIRSKLAFRMRGGCKMNNLGRPGRHCHCHWDCLTDRSDLPVWPDQDCSVSPLGRLTGCSDCVPARHVFTRRVFCQLAPSDWRACPVVTWVTGPSGHQATRPRLSRASNVLLTKPDI